MVVELLTAESVIASEAAVYSSPFFPGSTRHLYHFLMVLVTLNLRKIDRIHSLSSLVCFSTCDFVSHRINSLVG